MTKKLTIFYIVEPPDYTLFSCFLLASIREHLPADTEVIGYCPAHRMDEIQPGIFYAHEKMGAKILPMVTEGLWDPIYPHGNKIAACLQKRDSDFSMFIDSDVLFLSDTVKEDYIQDGHVSCSMAASMIWAEQTIWDELYGVFDMPIPTERYRLMRRGGKQIPYFSSGLLAFPEQPLASGKTFAEIWYDTAKQIDEKANVERKRPYLDQMSLPIAIQRAGLNWNILPEEKHFILGGGGNTRVTTIPRERKIHAVHYRTLNVLKEAKILRRARGLLDKYTGARFASKLNEMANPVAASEPDIVDEAK